MCWIYGEQTGIGTGSPGTSVSFPIIHSAAAAPQSPPQPPQPPPIIQGWYNGPMSGTVIVHSVPLQLIK
jgi:hypothetical protein